MKRDALAPPEQPSDWLSGRHSPFRKNRDKIELFLEGAVNFPSGKLKLLVFRRVYCLGEVQIFLLKFEYRNSFFVSLKE